MRDLLLSGGYSGNNTIEFDGVITNDYTDRFGENKSLITSQTFDLFGYPTTITSFGFRDRSSYYSELQLLSDYSFDGKWQWFSIQTTRLSDQLVENAALYINDVNNKQEYHYYGRWLFHSFNVGDLVHCKIVVDNIHNAEPTKVSIFNNSDRLQTTDYSIITATSVTQITLASNSQTQVTSFIGAPLVGNVEITGDVYTNIDQYCFRINDHNASITMR